MFMLLIVVFLYLCDFIDFSFVDLLTRDYLSDHKFSVSTYSESGVVRIFFSALFFLLECIMCKLVFMDMYYVFYYVVWVFNLCMI